MALQLRRTSPANKLRAITTLVALFALVAQPMYGMVAGQVASAASSTYVSLGSDGQQDVERTVSICSDGNDGAINVDAVQHATSYDDGREDTVVKITSNSDYSERATLQWENSHVGSGDINFTDDNIAIYNPTSNGFPINDGGDNTVLKFQAEETGTYTYKLQYADHNDNSETIGQESSITFEVVDCAADSEAPIITGLNGLNGNTHREAVHVTATVESDNLSHCYVQIWKGEDYIRNGYVSECKNSEEGPTAVELANLTEDGEYRVQFQAKDSAGNKDGNPSEDGSEDGDSVKNVWFTIDSTGPTSSLELSAENSLEGDVLKVLKDDTITINGSVEDTWSNLRNYNLSLYNGDVELTPTTDYRGKRLNADGDFWGTKYKSQKSVSIDENFNTSDLEAGEYQIRLNARDAAGGHEGGNLGKAAIVKFEIVERPEVVAENFNTNQSDAYEGITAGFRIDNFLNAASITDVTVELLRDDDTVVTKVADESNVDIVSVNDKTGTGKISVPFVISEGEFSEADDLSNWSLSTIDGEPVTPADWTDQTRPISVTFIVYYEGSNDPKTVTMGAEEFLDGTSSHVAYTSIIPEVEEEEGTATDTTTSDDTEGDGTGDSILNQGIANLGGPNFPGANQGGNPDEDATNEDEDADILGAAETTSPLDNTAAVAGDSTRAGALGLAWYWWAIILAAVVGTAWYLIAAARRNNQSA